MFHTLFHSVISIGVLNGPIEHRENERISTEMSLGKDWYNLEEIHHR